MQPWLSSHVTVRCPSGLSLPVGPLLVACPLTVLLLEEAGPCALQRVALRPQLFPWLESTRPAQPSSGRLIHTWAGWGLGGKWEEEGALPPALRKPGTGLWAVWTGMLPAWLSALLSWRGRGVPGPNSTEGSMALQRAMLL